ncbi:dihydrolipoyl dehydrogenase [Virgibacillus sp. C22-A2]|uniref:Dihydrolipoyl dehydrogenase n=1 Tax=Virgibacillus tibetensis TaxID=3042313 RepID=A0ABU6KFX6_9BACI|nr:dihydrolipoyl dehydrogenase [Virgibacillus sp. C22-A2]
MVVGEISQERDLVIIGGGPGGYNAAIRAAQLGLEVTLIETEDMGGVCLNKGCIPSKVWTHAAKKNAELVHLKELGIHTGNTSFDIKKLMAYKTKVTDQLRSGVEALCKANKIELIEGKASFLTEDRIGVENGHQFDVYVFKQAIIATGSTTKYPAELSGNSSRIFLSYEIFELPHLPEHLIIYGSDYISLEIASSYASFGSKVTILMREDEDFLFDKSINKELKRLLKRKKIQVKKQVVIQAVEETEKDIRITFADDKQTKQTVEGTHLVAIGEKKPNVNELGIGRLGMKQTDKGSIVINHRMQTSLPSIYAIGDVTEGPLLAVKAIKQGKAAVESIAGGNPEVDLTFLPVVAHTIPPIASVGLTEKEVHDHGLVARISQFPIGSNGYAMISNQRDGFIKVITDTRNDLILGVHMIGEGAVELSAVFVQLLEMAGKEEDVIFPNYAHPSMNEGLMEAVESLIGHAIHITPQKQ